LERETGVLSWGGDHERQEGNWSELKEDTTSQETTLGIGGKKQLISSDPTKTIRRKKKDLKNTKEERTQSIEACFTVLKDVHSN